MYVGPPWMNRRLAYHQREEAEKRKGRENSSPFISQLSPILSWTEWTAGNDLRVTSKQFVYKSWEMGSWRGFRDFLP